MKSLNMYLGSVIDNDGLHFESLLDDDDIFLGSGNDKKLVNEWIKNNYHIHGELTISDDFVVNCAGHVSVINEKVESLTNGLFRWGEVGGEFYCDHCVNLKSLKGAPKIVGESFYCDGCDKLTSIKGAPEEVGGYFYCGDCGKLTSLEGAPKSVSGGFYCEGCINLKTLKGAPKKVGGVFNCTHCNELKSLEGAPKKVGGSFECWRCKNLKITDSDRKKYKIVN